MAAEPAAGPPPAEMIDDGSQPLAAPPDREFNTETFSNARGWTAVRVTHNPTGASAERARSDGLRSAVQAQRECIEELRATLTTTDENRRRDDEATVRQPDAADLDLLLREIAYLRGRLNALEDDVRRIKGIAQD